MVGLCGFDTYIGLNDAVAYSGGAGCVYLYQVQILRCSNLAEVAICRHHDSLKYGVADHDQRCAAGTQCIVQTLRKFAAVVEVGRCVVGPSVAAIDTSFLLDAAQDLDFLCKVASRQIGLQLNSVEFAHGLPVFAEIRLFERVEVLRFFSVAKPVELRPCIAVIVIVVQVRRRRDDQIHRVRFQMLLIVEEGILNDSARRGIGRYTLLQPGDVLLHLQ